MEDQDIKIISLIFNELNTHDSDFLQTLVMFLMSCNISDEVKNIINDIYNMYNQKHNIKHLYEVMSTIHKNKLNNELESNKIIKINSLLNKINTIINNVNLTSNIDKTQLNYILNITKNINEILNHNGTICLESHIPIIDQQIQPKPVVLTSNIIEYEKIECAKTIADLIKIDENNSKSNNSKSNNDESDDESECNIFQKNEQRTIIECLKLIDLDVKNLPLVLMENNIDVKFIARYIGKKQNYLNYSQYIVSDKVKQMYTDEIILKFKKASALINRCGGLRKRQLHTLSKVKK